MKIKKITFNSIILAIIFSYIILFVYNKFLSSRANYILTDNTPLLITVLIIIIISSVVVHELLHALGWSIGNKDGFSSVKIFMNKFIPMCTCKTPMSKGKYLLGALFPLMVLGGIAIISLIVFPSNITLLFAAINILIASGDIIIVYKLLRVDLDLVLDHPEKAGFIGFKKNI